MCIRDRPREETRGGGKGRGCLSRLRKGKTPRASVAWPLMPPSPDDPLGGLNPEEFKALFYRSRHIDGARGRARGRACGAHRLRGRERGAATAGARALCRGVARWAKQRRRGLRARGRGRRGGAVRGGPAGCPDAAEASRCDTSPAPRAPCDAAALCPHTHWPTSRMDFKRPRTCAVSSVGAAHAALGGARGPGGPQVDIVGWLDVWWACLVF